MPERPVLDILYNGLIETGQLAEFGLSESPGHSGFLESDADTLRCLLQIGFGQGLACLWRITSHAANKFRGSSRIYLFRSELWLSTWPGTVSLLFFEDLISPRGPVMGKGL